MARSATPNNVSSLGLARARQMLEQMKANPFVLFVFEGDELTAYSSGLDEDSRELVLGLLADLA